MYKKLYLEQLKILIEKRNSLIENNNKYSTEYEVINKLIDSMVLSLANAELGNKEAEE